MEEMCRSLRPSFFTERLAIGCWPTSVAMPNTWPKSSALRSVVMNAFSGGGLGPQPRSNRSEPASHTEEKRMKRLLPHAVLAVAIPVVFSGCLDEKSQFIFGRVSDKCDTEWP